jgi:hypothetical protein
MAPASDAVPNLSLQDHRRRLDLTQEQVAEALVTLAWEHHGVRVGADGQMVSKWERGDKRPSRMYRGGVPLMVEKQAGAGSWAGMLCGRGDSLVDHLLMGL